LNTDYLVIDDCLESDNSLHPLEERHQPSSEKVDVDFKEWLGRLRRYVPVSTTTIECKESPRAIYDHSQEEMEL
jgi:hypothetical protein